MNTQIHVNYRLCYIQYIYVLYVDDRRYKNLRISIAGTRCVSGRDGLHRAPWHDSHGGGEGGQVHQVRSVKVKKEEEKPGKPWENYGKTMEKDEKTHLGKRWWRKLKQ